MRVTNNPRRGTCPWCRVNIWNRWRLTNRFVRIIRISETTYGWVTGWPQLRSGHTEVQDDEEWQLPWDTVRAKIKMADIYIYIYLSIYLSLQIIVYDVRPFSSWPHKIQDLSSVYTCPTTFGYESGTEEAREKETREIAVGGIASFEQSNRQVATIL